MMKLTLPILALAAVSACNGYNPVSAAAQDAHNRALKATVSPEGFVRPTSATTSQVVVAQ